MARETERSMEELYRDDPERADALIYGRRVDSTRRGFLGGAGLAAIGAVDRRRRCRFRTRCRAG